MVDYGKELARLRKEKGLTLKALAELARTKPKYIGDLEHGKPPGIEVASKLARALDVPLDVFWIKQVNQRQYIDTKAAEECEKICRREVDSSGLEKLTLSQRALKALYCAKIESMEELVQLSEKELSKIRGLGRATLREIKDKLLEYQIE